MTSKKDATSQKSMILSPTDLKIAKLKYKAGERFLQKGDALQNNGYSSDMRGVFGQENVVVQIDSYEVNHLGEVGYRLSIIHPKQDWRLRRIAYIHC